MKKPTALRPRRDENRPAGIAKNILALGFVGDGLVALVWPKRQLSLWMVGPKPYQRLTRAVRDRPMLVRMTAAAELAAALWWTRRIYQRHGA